MISVSLEKYPNFLRFKQKQNSTHFLILREKLTSSKVLTNRAIDFH